MPDDTIYYVYNKHDGSYGGSGITLIDDDDWGSTTVVPPEEPARPVLTWDGTAWSWAPTA